jgi:hypothetical protein
MRRSLDPGAELAVFYPWTFLPNGFGDWILMIEMSILFRHESLFHCPENLAIIESKA